MFPDNYDSLNWCVKLAILDPIRLAAWERVSGRLVPSEEEARLIGLASNWQIFMEEANETAA